jgi:hypothetical protein
MFRDKRKLASLVTVLSCFFCLQLLILSAHIHIHINSKIDQDGVNCPVCQLARGTVKFLYADKVVKLHPLIVVTVISLAASLIVSRHIAQSSTIRGPPVV